MEENNKKLKLKINSTLLKNTVAALLSTVKNTIVKVNKDNISISSINYDNTVMVNLDFGIDKFIEYEVENEFEFAIDLLNLNKVIKSLDGSISMEIENNKLFIESDINRIMIPLIDLELNHVKEYVKNKPTFNIPEKIIIDRKIFTDTLKVASKIDDQILLEIYDKMFHVETKNKTKYRLELLMENLDSNVNVSSYFSIDKLLDILKPLKTNNIELNLGVNVPIKIKIDGIEFLVMNRIETDN